MAVETKIYYGSSLIDTVYSANVALKFYSGAGLKYKPSGGSYVLIDKIDSSVDSASPTELSVAIEDGNGWYLTGSENPIVIGDGPSSGGLRWVYSGSDVAVTAWYPSREDAEIVADLWDSDQPPIRLKVVVRRV